MTGYKLWAFVGIGALAAILYGVVLWQQNKITDVSARLEANAVRIDALTKANLANRKIIETQAQARIDNDAIAVAVAAKLGDVKTREVNTRTIIEKAKQDDPATRDWSSVPIPGVLRDALNSPGAVRTSAP